MINPTDGKVIPNATVMINGDRIERVSMGKQDAASLDKQVDCFDKFILSGYIDTHVHFFQSGDIYTCPDAVESGLTPMQILVATTTNAAKAFGGTTGPKIGAIEPGNFADLVILNSNPLDDIAHASDIDAVMKNGILYPADSILANTPAKEDHETN